MMVFNSGCINSQIHPDTQKYLNRVKADSGSIREPVITALNEFVKYCYRVGLRNNSGGTTHTIRMCSIFATTTSAGAYNRLWTPNATLKDTPGGSVTYSESGGAIVSGAGGYIDTGVVSNTYTVNNVSIFMHNLTNAGSKDYMGADDSVTSGATTTNRFVVHTRWTDDGNCYFDVGNSTTGTTGGRISALNSTNCIGLMVAIKNNASQYVYQRGVSLVSRTTAPTTGLTMSTDTLTFTYSRSGDTAIARGIGGVGFGTAIPVTLVAGFTTVWNAVQTALGRSV